MNKMKRVIVIAITIPVSYVLQMIALPAIPHLIAVPNLLLAGVISFGFLYGRSIGLVTGVISGLLLDFLGSGTPGFYTLIFALLGYGDGFLSEKMESEIVVVLFGLLLVNEVLFHAYVFLFGFLIGKRFSLSPYLLSSALPEFLMTMIGFLIIYGILLFFSKRWDLKVNKGDVRIV
ncbi:MAG: rod shape-determining protein MreD [Lachnospiraceae bacterium]|nr:rod shape-determining protein MreD [Lachnospiraceae bacterium]